jgi:arylsulfatase A-like enzyme
VAVTAADARNRPKARVYASPNIAVYMTDDHAAKTILGTDASGKAFMPFIASKLPAARVFKLTHLTPVCGPSRASFFTGQYPRHHTIIDNILPDGGFARYMQLGLDQVSFPKLLQPDYHTAMNGKFINQYGMVESAGLPNPVGWDDWFSLINPKFMFNWDVNKNGVVVHYEGNTDDVYQTNVMSDRSQFSDDRQITAYNKPFFKLVATFNTHSPWQEANKYKNLYQNEPFQPGKMPSYNQQGVNKVYQYPALSEQQIVTWRDRWRHSVANGRSVDDLFNRDWVNQRTNGQLEHTHRWLFPDNGYNWGDLRQLQKGSPYEESLSGMFAAWGPGVVPGTDDHIITVADLAVTALAIAGKPIPPEMDGRDISPLLRGESPPWRTSVLAQEVPETDPSGTSDRHWLALVTKDWVFIRYRLGIEFYDLIADPYEMNNIAGSLAHEFVDAVEDRIDALYACTGAAECGPIEDAPLPVR